MAKKKKQKDKYGEFTLTGDLGYYVDSDFNNTPIFSAKKEDAKVFNSEMIAQWVADNYKLNVNENKK